ncbi:hypothetical protein FRC07_001358 [Ceratobasidium sp. 392]|nr:hypothetical protein FRC07_001358 [Ceratobasidium sp. 392]
MPSGSTSTEPVTSILVMGRTETGKSTFVKDASKTDPEAGHGLNLQVGTVQPGPVFQLDGRSFQLYDIPGLDGFMFTNMPIFKAQCWQKITGIVYLHRITDNGKSDASVQSFELFTKICGLSNMRNVVIMTNMWSYPENPEENRQGERLKTGFFSKALKEGAQIVKRAGPGYRSAQAVVILLRNRQPVDLQLQIELEHGSSLYETGAGSLIEKDLFARLQRQRLEKGERERELRDAREDRDRRAEDQLTRFLRDREWEIQRLEEMVGEVTRLKSGRGAK